MKYTIGEVSALLHISREMIRYYEKQGAIKSSRNEKNNYRSYDSMEIFWLIEAMWHKSWGIPINNISDIRREHYSSKTESFLREEVNRQEQIAAYTQMFVDRLNEVRKYAQLGIINIGNFWVDELPGEYRCHLVTSRNDEYGRMNLPEEVSRFLFSDRCIPFTDSGLTLQGEDVEWEMILQEKYAAGLGNDVPVAFEKVPGSLCLCTNIDIGEIGEFKQESLYVLKDYACSHGYRIPKNGMIRGKLIGRGYEGGQFRRILRLSIPVTLR